MSAPKPFYIMREGAKWPVAPWVRDLSALSRREMFANKLDRFDDYERFRKHLTKVEYTAPLPEAADAQG